MENILNCAKKTIPRGIVKKYSPFWNEELQKLKAERDVARENAERTKTLADRKVLKDKTNALRSQIILAKRNAFQIFLKELDFRRDGVKAHQFVSRLNNTSPPKKSIPMQRGSKLLTSGRDIAKYFCDHYAKVSNFNVTKENRKLINKEILHTCPSQEEIELFYNDFGILDLDRALLKNKKGKSAGPDEIMPEFLNNLGVQARSTLLMFMNLVWNTYLPAEWRKAEIIPIPKKGKEPTSPENFRPVALTSVLCKVYERMILSRLQIYFEKNRLLSPNQAGFTKHRSAIEQVLRLSQEIKDGFHRKQSTLAVFVDFKTAFDKVWRKGLLAKLLRKGVKGKMFSSISSFLSQRFIRARYNNYRSAFRQTHHGLPQGSVISPFLFNVMMDDLISKIESLPGIQALLYADDLVIWASCSSTVALEQALTQALKVLKSWSVQNEMLVNPLKTEFEMFTLSTKQHSVSLLFDGHPLKQTSNAQYLGVKMDSKLNWVKQIDNLAEKGNKRTQLLRRLAGTKWGASQDVLAQTYSSYVRPVMEYSAEVIATASASTLKKLDSAQNNALRIITGAPKSTPIAAMEIQCNLEPLGIRRDMAVLKMNEHLQRIGINYWKNYKQPSQRLKTQGTFLSMAEALGVHYELPTSERQVFPKFEDSYQENLAQGVLHLTKNVKKKTDTQAQELRALAMETIHERYPSGQWLHVYTDGSAKDATSNAGAGVYCSVFTISEPVGKVASNFDGEVKAVLLALKRLDTVTVTNVVFLIDSQAAIQALSTSAPNESLDVLECRISINNLIKKNKKVIVLQWIPSHCGIRGNEEADRLAKLGANMSQPEVSISYESIKRLIRAEGKRQVLEKHASQSEGKQWSVLVDRILPGNLPRSVGVACFRLITGHDYLQAHLHRIGVADDPTCVLCGEQTMTGDHLSECVALSQRNINDVDNLPSRAQLYWAARNLMAERQ